MHLSNSRRVQSEQKRLLSDKVPKRGQIAASKGTIDVSDPIAHEIGGTIHLGPHFIHQETEG
jgi:hypothetical protein